MTLPLGAKIPGMCMPLATIADDGDALSGEHLEVCICIIIQLCHESFPSAVGVSPSVLIVVQRCLDRGQPAPVLDDRG
jgi:hypothetical protein